MKAKVATKKAASTKTEPTNKNETAPSAPLASEETVESHQPSTPDNPLEETRIDSAEGAETKGRLARPTRRRMG